MDERQKTLVREHIDRCIECYSMDMVDLHKKTIGRESYEQMRADLMLAIGMLMAFDGREPPH